MLRLWPGVKPAHVREVLSVLECHRDLQINGLALIVEQVMAVGYALTQWPKLIRRIEDSAPDTNARENAIRPFEVGRKN